MDKKRLLKLAGMVTEKSPTYGVANSKVEDMLERIAATLAAEAKELAGEVYDEEGAGRSGAKTKKEYVVWAVKRFLDNEYKRSIIKHLADSYKEAITEEHAASDPIVAMANQFEKLISSMVSDQGDADAWAEAGQELMAQLHEELKNRGLYG